MITASWADAGGNSRKALSRLETNAASAIRRERTAARK
jgi:hypothetical protein